MTRTTIITPSVERDTRATIDADGTQQPRSDRTEAAIRSPLPMVAVRVVMEPLQLSADQNAAPDIDFASLYPTSAEALRISLPEMCGNFPLRVTEAVIDACAFVVYLTR